MRKEVIGDEETCERKGSHERGCLVGWSEKGDGRSRQGMPQMKGLKELKLPVRQRIEDVWQDCIALHMRFCHILFMDIDMKIA
jgi:hypothetical protein